MHLSPPPKQKPGWASDQQARESGLFFVQQKSKEKPVSLQFVTDRHTLLQTVTQISKILKNFRKMGRKCTKLVHFCVLGPVFGHF